MERDYNRGNRGRGGSRGSRGSRGNRGYRGGFRGKRGSHQRGHKNEINDMDDYFNIKNNQNQNQEYQYHEKPKNKKKKNINNLDDYFNYIDNENKDNINNIDNINIIENNINENNDYEDYNIFSNNNENNIYKGKNKGGHKKKNQNKINENYEEEGFNKSNKEINEIKNIKKVYISYIQLREIIDKTDNEIITFFMKFKDLPDVFKNTKFTEDMKDLMTELLSKISNINSGPAVVILNQILGNTDFLAIIRERLRGEDYKNYNYIKFLYNVAQLNNKLIDKFTDDKNRIKHSELCEYSDFVKKLIDEGQMENNLELALKLVDTMNEFKEKEQHKKMNKIQEKEREKEKEKLNNENNDKFDSKYINSIPIDYKNRNIQLSLEDFNEKIDILIAPHIKSGSYISYERYINTMFYLEYEDCYRDLKKTINAFKSMNKSVNNMDKKELQKLSRAYSDLYFYLKGEIIFVDINRDGVILTMDFIAPTPRKIKFTKRMITGSLIILTDNNYENYLLTTVFYNPYVDIKLNKQKKKQRIKIPKFPYYRVQLSLANIGPESFAFLIKNRKNLQIFESKAYFESYIHVLKRLKEINIIDLPFEEELINSNFKNLLLPKIEENYCYNYNE